MILKAIDSYDVYNTASKSVLKTLVAMPPIENNIIKMVLSHLFSRSVVFTQN